MSQEEESGTLTPTSSSGSTAVDHPLHNGKLPSPQKSPLLRPEGLPKSSLTVPRPTSSRPRDRRSFSSAQKLPILEPSSSPLRKQFDFLLLWILQTITVAYLYVIAIENQIIYKIRGAWYNWHAWAWVGKWMIPRDVAKLPKVPRHIAVILDERKATRGYDADEMVKRATEFATWCACAGIPIITIYERNGLLKKDIKKIQRAVQKSIATYMNAPMSSYTVDVHTPQTTLLTNSTVLESRDMEILVIGQEDSRLPIVDLARTLGDMIKQEQLFPEDITIDLVHENLTENLMTEPDLLVLFSPRVDLQGFPPWQIRLTEIFHLQDNTTFDYSVFIQALQMYTRAEMRVGR